MGRDRLGDIVVDDRTVLQLKRSMKATCPAISQQLKLTVNCFWWIKCIRYCGNVGL
jgi:hypothetical protein